MMAGLQCTRRRAYTGFVPRLVHESASYHTERKNFIEQRDLAETSFQFYSDPANGVAKEYGIVNEKTA